MFSNTREKVTHRLSKRMVTKVQLACTVLFSAGSIASSTFAAELNSKVSFDEYIREAVVPSGVIDAWLRGPAWAQFDPEVGYILRNSLMPWGMDHSVTIETTQATGARTILLYANKKVRINTYGDSFTESAQVSDGETWQEYLAGNLGEPVRNFGVGGYGVYQAYRRMVREEQTEHGAPYLILTICCDDPSRSLMRSRFATMYRSWSWQNEAARFFHGNFWSNLEMDLNTGRFVEKEQLLPTRTSLHLMSDAAWMADHLRDDMELQLSTYVDGLVGELNRERVTRLAALLDFPFDWNVSDTNTGQDSGDAALRTPMQVQVAALLNRYGQRATLYILDRAREFARRRNKRLLVVLNNTTAFEEKSVREDQEILDHLAKEKFAYVDINQAFRDEFLEAKTTMTFADFMKQYMVDGVGHLNPQGNHFVAYALKDKVISMLDPKPTPYQPIRAQTVNWDGYLRGGGYRH